MNLRNSPTLLSEVLPKSSVETTFLMLAAKRCSLIARAAAFISRDSATTNLPSFTVLWSRAAPPAGSENSKLCWTVWPAATTTSAVCVGRPV